MSTPKPTGTERDEAASQVAGQVDALCERVRHVALASGEAALEVKRREAAALIEERRARAAAESEQKLALARQRLSKQANRELQNTRLEARARIARSRWAELDQVLDEAERRAGLVRSNDRGRFISALSALLKESLDQLDESRVAVYADPSGIAALQEQWSASGRQIEFVPADIDGIRIVTADQNTVLDQSIGQRRRRLDNSLRLRAAEVLFGRETGDE